MRPRFEKQRKTTSFALILGMLAILASPAYGSDWAFTGFTPNGHRGPVTAAVFKGNTILSAGEDGFLEIWESRGAQERLQISPYRIIAMAERPGKDEVCFIESDGLGLYRIGAWNYKERKIVFSRQLRDHVNAVFYSMGGNFIIAVGTGLIFFDSATGNVLQSPESLTGTGAAGIGLAATGRSERNMVAYITSGSLSYWDLETGRETNRFAVPPNLHSPVLFGNSRYLAGIDTEGLAVINAVTGELLARDNDLPGNLLLCPSGEELLCLAESTDSASVYRYTIDRSGRMNRAGKISLPNPYSGGEISYYTAIAANSGTKGIALGTYDGSIMLAGTNGQPRTLATRYQAHITEAEVSGSTIAFLTNDGTVGFIPLEYSQFTARKTIQIEKNTSSELAVYTRITAFAGENGASGQFVFWHDADILTKPIIRSSSPNNKKMLGDITFRSPVRSADSFGGKILFLDSTGNLTVVSPLDTKSRLFTFFSVGLMDAAFVDSSRVIIGRSAISGNTPFMLLNASTGETVPLPYPAQAGIIMHRGAQDAIYAVAVSPANDSAGIRTFVLQLNLADIVHSAKMVDFPGEDTSFSLAETHRAGEDTVQIAATIGGENAMIYNGAYHQKLDRTVGLPLKLIDGKSALISLDKDGSICWHDNSNGKLLAVFRLHPDGWTLQTERGTVTGPLSK